MLDAPPIIIAPARDFSSRKNASILGIVLHHTAGTNSLSWLKGNANGTSCHVLIARNGTSYRMVEDRNAAHHVGFSRWTVDGVTYSRTAGLTCNHVTLGIELENLGDGVQAYPPEQLLACAWWIQHWRELYGELPVFHHRDIDEHGKTDPKGLTAETVLALIVKDREGTTEPVLMSLVPASQVITEETRIISDTDITAATAAAYLWARRPHKTYTKEDCLVIAKTYWHHASKGGINPLVAWAQMIHETGGLTSWWSIRPRRNPCGLGVTGETVRGKKPTGAWSFDTVSSVWKRGHVFSTWDASVQAHIGHMLVYACPPNLRNAEQAHLVSQDPRASAVAVGNIGTCHLLSDLANRWAVPGTNYPTAIAKIATAIAKGQESS